MIGTIALIGALLIGVPTELAGEVVETSVIASFEGREIRLADGWGDAHACFVSESGVRCYRSESEMNLTEGTASSGQTSLGFRSLVTCSSQLRLYDGTSKTGDVVLFNVRGTSIPLSGYGFNNKTSSYSVGACAAVFYDVGVGSAQYPGSTSAGASANTMISGWDNRISTIYIS